MPKLSKHIRLFSEEKYELVNEENKALLQKYIMDMTLRELSPGTVASRRNDLRVWFIYVLENQDNQNVKDLTNEDIAEFLFFFKQNGNNSERMKVRMSALSCFYKFLRQRKLILENPMEFMDRPKKGQPVITQTFLTKEQVNLMKQKLTEFGDTQLHTYALLSLSTMARVRAIASIRWDQIDYENRVIRDVLEKENKVVDLFFSEEVKDLLLKLKSERQSQNINDHGWVFHTNRNTDESHANNSTLGAWCKHVGSMIGVPTLHPHDFRHSGATLLKNAGMPLEDVSVLLNHSGVDVTRRCYIKEDKSRISKLKDEFNII